MWGVSTFSPACCDDPQGQRASWEGMRRTDGTDWAQPPEPVPPSPLAIRVEADRLARLAREPLDPGPSYVHAPNTPCSPRSLRLCAPRPSRLPRAGSCPRAVHSGVGIQAPPGTPRCQLAPRPPAFTCCRRGLPPSLAFDSPARPGGLPRRPAPGPPRPAPRAASSHQIRPRPLVNTPPFTRPEPPRLREGQRGPEGNSQRKPTAGCFQAPARATHNIHHRPRPWQPGGCGRGGPLVPWGTPAPALSAALPVIWPCL